MSRKTKKKHDLEIAMHVMTNDPARGAHMCRVFEMIHTAVFNNLLGLMEGLNKETGELELLIVGLEPTNDNKMDVYPLARVFSTPAEANKYLSPDGKGGFHGQENAS